MTITGSADRPEPFTRERLLWLERQAEIEATCAAFERWAARRARRRAVVARILRPVRRWRREHRR